MIDDDEIVKWRQGHLWLIENCAERYRREVIENERLPSPVRFARGSSVHFVIAEAHKKQMADRGEWDGVPSAFTNPPGTAESVKEARDLAATSFDERQRSGMSFTEDEYAEGVKVVLGRQKDAAVAMAGMYVSKVAPRIYPLGVERRVIMRPKNWNVEVSGTADLIEGMLPAVVDANGLPAMRHAVVDWKTGERAPNKKAAGESNQLTFYAMLHRGETGRLPDKVSLIHLVRSPKQGLLSVVRQDSTRTEDDVNALVSRLRRATAAVNRGVFMPNIHWWGCSAKWCPFWSTCPFPEGRARVPVEEE